MKDLDELNKLIKEVEDRFDPITPTGKFVLSVMVKHTELSIRILKEINGHGK